jgi:hypothetical protein
MANTQRRYRKNELVRRGDAICEKDLRPQIKARGEGRFAAIDIETGEFGLGADERKACDKRRERLPDAQIWMVRVGSPYVHRIGAAS